MTRNGSIKHALKKNSEIFRESAFSEDGTSVFHPLISGAAVFRRCKQARITKLGEETRDSANVLIAQQMVPNSEFQMGFSRMDIRVPLMYSLSSATCASYATTCKPRSRRYALAWTATPPYSRTLAPSERCAGLGSDARFLSSRITIISWKLERKSEKSQKSDESII